ncbi:DNA internalization-related competence protein ComEC/Rec2 [Pseudobutyrivibrio sp. LB2011]|uniref:DNA internalization-related competence protein ComEC/Rec2 n=1 Tax=Pseudobutyrivibrio sp. LB2011 TaxID=1408312 RepID=UPI0005D266CE|nr:DNA internalization-related competence protein ComEC/Rec2 [Pseudobutyrivibrio sp. LB2011]
MLRGRRLCKISLLIIITIAFSVHGPWDFLGVYTKANAADCMPEGIQVQAVGRVYHKEIKNDSVLYYVRNATVDSEIGRLSNTSFIFKFNSDEIPNYCKLNIEGKVSHFMTSRNDGAFDMNNYYQSMGLYFELSNPEVLGYSCGLLSGKDILYKLSQALDGVYHWALPGEEAGFLSSIAIGNKGDLLGDLRELFQMVGVAHVLAVSGLHVSVVCMSFYKLLRRRGKSFICAGILAGIVAVFYGLFTGGSISSVRAICMFLIFLLADILGEAYDSLTALAVVADFLLLGNPLLIRNGSFIFSFGAILGIWYVALPLSGIYGKYCNERKKLMKSDDGFGKAIKKPIHRVIVEYFVSSFIFSIGIYGVMLPIVTQMYHETPVYSSMLNLLILPLMPVLLGLGLLGGFLGLIYLPLGKLILMPCHFVIYIFEMIASMFSKLPNANAIVGHRGIIRIVIYYGLIFAAWRLSELFNSHIDAELINPRTRISYIRSKMLVTMGLFIVVICTWFIPSKQSFEVDILDVGQGDGIYISSQDGVRFFIDGGSTSSDAVGKYTLLPFLKYKGASHIDYWFLSHMDMDHVSGVLELLESGYRIDNIVLSAEIPSDDTLSQLLELCKANGTNVLYMNQGDKCGSRHLSFTCIYPFDGLVSDDINALSLALLMEYDKDGDGTVDYSGFFGGDLGAEQEIAIAQSGNVGHVDLLKVSHHGSRFSSDSDFLSLLSPDVAVISCAKVNRYGHPAAEAVERIEAAAGSIYYTMDSGRVRARAGGVDVFIQESQ